MVIKSADFVKSSKILKDCPKILLPEYAFIGRSNVGKSSLINLLTGRNTLAKTSVTPGKTQLINHFIINNDWYLVDLPGIGYAKVSHKEKRSWEVMITNYLLNRECLLNTFMLIDSRLEPQQIDFDFMTELVNKQIPFSIVFTKTDKLKKNELTRNITKYKQYLLLQWKQLPDLFYSSVRYKTGRNEILNFIEEINRIFNAGLHQ